MSEEKEKGCNTCGKYRHGFQGDPSWDACDCTCNGTLLFCTHGMTHKHIYNKLVETGKNCKNWCIKK